MQTDEGDVHTNCGSSSTNRGDNGGMQLNQEDSDGEGGRHSSSSRSAIQSREETEEEVDEGRRKEGGRFGNRGGFYCYEGWWRS